MICQTSQLSIQDALSWGMLVVGTYTHPDADHQEAFIRFEVSWRIGRLID